MHTHRLPILPLPGQRLDRERIADGDTILATGWFGSGDEAEVTSGTLVLGPDGFLVGVAWFDYSETIVLERVLFA